MPTRKGTEKLFAQVDGGLYRWLSRQAQNEGRFQYALVEEALRDLKRKRALQRKLQNEISQEEP